MKLKIYSYRYAKEILEHYHYKNIYDELIEICEECPLPVYKDKSEKQKTKDVVQQIINTYFKIKFSKYDWECEPYATPSEKDDKLRADFRKKFYIDEKKKLNLQIEVEMGNAASYYRDYFKFQLSYNFNLISIGILIVPTSKLAIRIDSGLGDFDKVIREIESAKLSFTLPILVIGLDPLKTMEIDVTKISKNIKAVKPNGRVSEENLKPHNEIVKKVIHIHDAHLKKLKNKKLILNRIQEKRILRKKNIHKYFNYK